MRTVEGSMRLLALALLACGTPALPGPEACDDPAPTCCAAISGLARCLNGRGYTCEPAPSCAGEQPICIEGSSWRAGRTVFTDAGC